MDRGRQLQCGSRDNARKFRILLCCRLWASAEPVLTAVASQIKKQPPWSQASQPSMSSLDPPHLRTPELQMERAATWAWDLWARSVSPGVSALFCVMLYSQSLQSKKEPLGASSMSPNWASFYKHVQNRPPDYRSLQRR